MFQKLIAWSQSEFNALPWRKNRSLYSTLVSEIMLQQTTVSTVLNHYEKFLQKYPTPLELAKASEQELLISWKGLGYYRRARNLKKACEVIVDVHQGKISLQYETLTKIPGIGDYTANALIAIGANQKALAIDANLERVLARLYALEEVKGPKLIKAIKNINALEDELNEFGGRAVNESLMDLGRTYCQARKTQCDLCPLKNRCLALKKGKVDKIPKIKDKIKDKHELTLLRVILKKGENFLVYQKKDHQWLSGQYELPTFILESSDSNLKQYPYLEGEFDYLPEFKSAITKYKITNKVLWVNEHDLKKLGLNQDRYAWSKDNLSIASLKAIKL